MQRAFASWERDHRSAFKTEVSELMQSTFFGAGVFDYKNKPPPTQKQKQAGRQNDYFKRTD